ASLPADRLAADGVSCSLCHQIRPEGLGLPSSFTAGFHIDSLPAATRLIFGPFQIDAGRTHVMESATAFAPAMRSHLRDAEFCATCHTLHTHALDSSGNEVGRFPEQVPYLEWRHSEYRDRQTCQECHMPLAGPSVPIASVLPVERDEVRRHLFRGGNFLMPRIFARHAADLGVTASVAELDATAQRAVEHLRDNTARLHLGDAEITEGRLTVSVTVENLAGHKLPTAYPSRRAWIHFIVRDASGQPIFESGALDRSGAIQGNDNDADSARYEPHHLEITTADEVQIYEPILIDSDGAVTTGLIRAVRFAKDNRILPRGFDKATAEDDVAVHGEARDDVDFGPGKDTIRYRIDVGAHEGPFAVEAALWYQPIAFRWAANLTSYDTAESARFGSFYRSFADRSATIIARTAAEVSRR
ncbi:MAG TPA: hypothetical protein VFT12_02450, partial [Thermoanaerobaculia bacterium]|nr:hypothetical protein [Thermoanaerobaculia bacterium]